MATLLEAALTYAKLGWSVLPVSERKTPLTPHGVKDASKDSMVLHNWFNNPSANPWGIAIATGTPSGFDVLDLDTKNIPLSGFPETYTVETPRGYHLYFQLGAPGNKVAVLPHLDFRSTNGYVIAPPSPGYAPLKSQMGSGIELALASWPSELQILLADSNGIWKYQNIPPIGPGIPEGSRDDALYRYACWLRGQGVTDIDLAELVRTRNWTYAPPLSEKEVETKIAQALKRPLGKATHSAPIKTIDLLDVKEEKLKWAIEPWLLDSCVTSLEGDGSVGKSLLAMHWCALLSQRGWHCLYASAEEIASTMLRPRALASEVVPEKISFIQKQDIFRLPDSLHALEDTIATRQTKFLVLDPLTSFFAGTSDMNNPQACRQIVEGLNNLAERTSCTVLVIRHWNKMIDAPLNTRGMGSKDLGNLVRSQLGIIQHPENSKAFLLFGIKTNFADPTSVVYDKGQNESGGWHAFNPRQDAYWTKERIEYHVRTKGRTKTE